MSRMSFGTAGTVTLVVAGALAFGTSANAQNQLSAIKAAQAPKLESLDADPAWAKAPELKIKVNNGAHLDKGSTTVALKAVYTPEKIYVLVRYADPTQSLRREPYVKQADGSWKKLTDPDDKGGDNTKYYEDKFALIWNISVKGFPREGCFAMCHEDEAGKPFGNKYTETEGELADLWHMKSVRTGFIGQVDDQYVDNTRYDKDKAADAGRHGDPKTGGGYSDVKLVNGKPEFMSKSAKAANKGGTYWLRDDDKVAFDDSKFVAGDEVASILVSPFAGDRGEIDTKIAWKDGTWTAALSRKLATGSKYDVQFTDLNAEYLFGVAVFDNAQVRHAYHKVPIKLVFAK